MREEDIKYIHKLERRIQELEMRYENTGAIFSRQVMSEKIEKLEQQNKRYREAVKKMKIMPNDVHSIIVELEGNQNERKLSRTKSN